jgi:probable HAF family extracellular repeat protein
MEGCVSLAELTLPETSTKKARRRNVMKRTQLVVTTTLAIFVLASYAHAQKYHAFIWNSGSGLTDLGTLGGDTSYAFGVNDSGEVVGYSYLADNVTRHAFTWTASGGMVDLGTLPGGSWSQGEKINASGEIAGEALDANGKQVPVFWSPSTGFISLGENPGTDQRNYAFGLNDAGFVTGQMYDRSDVVHAYIWKQGFPKPRLLPALPGGLHTVGNDINNQNHIAGFGSLANGRYEAFVWSQDDGIIGIGFVAGANTTLTALTIITK